MPGTSKKHAQVAVLGDGAWGTVLSLLLCGNGSKTTLWSPFPDYASEMEKKRENTRFLAGTALPPELGITGDIAAAAKNAEMLVLASPSQYMRATLERLKPHFRPETILVNVSKGIENGTLKRMSELCRELLGECRYVVLSGPSHAEEVVRRSPTAVVAASAEHELALHAQNIFMNDYFRTYTSTDVVSVELGGALKNVLAIAAGVIDGMGIGDNPKAALITRGIAEMGRLGVALGGRSETFAGLSGIGDLIVTCTSGHSRNRHVGEELGRGKALETVMKEMGMVVAEGVHTAKSAWELANKHGVETPIINEVYATLYKGKSPRKAVIDLMTRKARYELDNP
ncbi:MAG: glycerol-3-phosphate dehydrogenase [Lentisphaerae bacterium GWF2_52_8]|nr:MAG: glycerol-3-phosphate dehydrogenase [Lentisphaerae bacterium GWF2_52_8]